MCNSYYRIDDLIDIRYGSNSFADIQEGMLIRMNILNEKLKDVKLHKPTQEEIEKIKQKNEEYAKECRESAKVSEKTLYRRFTI